jgi:4-diphosphocytidyl-2-C-methyl-D-erythritol kinase
MHLLRNGSSIVVHAPAKVNLYFEVLGKRSDGYHEIETLMCPISLYDTLCVSETSDSRIRFECTIASSAAPGDSWGGDVPSGGTNLVVRAVEWLRRRTGANRGIAIRLVKRIPTAAGLGGGSSDAAAALIATNALWNLGLSQAELWRGAAELGSDVPFFLAGGAAICRGRGEHVEPVMDIGKLHLVVVRPPAGLSTADVYRACRVPEQPQSPKPLLEALARGDQPQIGRLLLNRLAPAAAGLSTWMERLRVRLAGLDLVGYSMSGSGSAWYGICRHAGQARRLASRLRAMRAGSVFAVQSCC